MNNYNRDGTNTSDTNPKFDPPTYGEIVGGVGVDSSLNNHNMPYPPYPPANTPFNLNSTPTYGFNPNVPGGPPQTQQQQQPPIVIQVEPGYGGYGGYGYGYGNNRRWNGMTQVPPEYWKFFRIFLFIFVAVFAIILIMSVISFVRFM